MPVHFDHCSLCFDTTITLEKKGEPRSCTEVGKRMWEEEMGTESSSPGLLGISQSYTRGREKSMNLKEDLHFKLGSTMEPSC